MRGLIPELDSPHPIGLRLPALYADSDFTQRFVSAFDAALAPIFVTLDCLPAYFDPRLAPEDFLDWLAGWVGLLVDESWSIERRRELVSRAVELHRWRGTRRGLAEHVRLVTGGEVEVSESGACAWSQRPQTPLPGADQPALLIRVRVPDPSTVDQRRLDALVAASKPAHLPHTIEVLHLP
ncbi:MAG TPA: phage tail protein [Pseudonocardiaceae bacterium]|jgi:phage tail-like protein|nr:phage tail protein [Pseudonocardiaceae bacterium]